jgi:hypothetical protein
MVKQETKKEQEIWGIGWTQGTATNPPERVIVNSETEEGYDLLTAMAILLNNQEKLKKLLD